MRPFIAVTDYGEVVKVTPNAQDGGNSYIFTTLFSDNTHIFHAACMVKDDLYVLDTKGLIMHFGRNSENNKEPSVIILGKDNKQKKSRKFSFIIDDTWVHMKALENGELVAAGSRNIVWTNPVNGNVTYTFVTEHDITALGTSDDMLLVFCDNGDIISFNDQHISTHLHIQLPKEYKVTSYYYQSNEQRHIVGVESGDVYIYDNYGKLLTTLIGHSGRITNIDMFDTFLVTSSYDKNVSIWNMSDITALMTPIEISFKQWPLSFALDKPAQTLQVGLAKGDIETVRISIEKNVESTRRNITREFTPQEWDYYIGDNVPFINFKQR
jgi:WD40 repeat protein